jgi:hypothetical protein
MTESGAVLADLAVSGFIVMIPLSATYLHMIHLEAHMMFYAYRGHGCAQKQFKGVKGA